MITKEFIFDHAPFPARAMRPPFARLHRDSSPHISAWQEDGSLDVGIWVSRAGRCQQWLDPVGKSPRGKQLDGKPLPCWNPVLFQTPGGPTMLFSIRSAPKPPNVVGNAA